MADNAEMKVTDAKEIAIINRYRGRKTVYKKIKGFLIIIGFIALIFMNIYTYYHTAPKDINSPEGLYYQAMDKKKSYNYGEATSYLAKIVQEHPKDKLAGLADNEMKDIQKQSEEAFVNLKSRILDNKMKSDDKLAYCSDFLSMYDGVVLNSDMDQAKKFQDLLKGEQQTASWRQKTFESLHVRVKFPQTWSMMEDEMNRFKGGDGYIFLEAAQIPQNNLENLVLKEKQTVALYGSKAQYGKLDIKLRKNLLKIDELNADECYIITPAKDLSEACIVVRYPSFVNDYGDGWGLIIHTTIQYVQVMANNITFIS